MDLPYGCKNSIAAKRLSGALVAESSSLTLLMLDTSTVLLCCSLVRKKTCTRSLLPCHFGSLFSFWRDILRNIAFVRIELLLHSCLS
jgi:1,4-dihydroxy-2-naphthoate octaprenyltransferase